MDTVIVTTVETISNGSSVAAIVSVISAFIAKAKKKGQ